MGAGSATWFIQLLASSCQKVRVEGVGGGMRSGGEVEEAAVPAVCSMGGFVFLWKHSVDSCPPLSRRLSLADSSAHRRASPLAACSPSLPLASAPLPFFLPSCLGPNTAHLMSTCPLRQVLSLPPSGLPALLVAPQLFSYPSQNPGCCPEFFLFTQSFTPTVTRPSPPHLPQVPSLLLSPLLLDLPPGFSLFPRSPASGGSLQTPVSVPVVVLLKSLL